MSTTAPLGSTNAKPCCGFSRSSGCAGWRPPRTCTVHSTSGCAKSSSDASAASRVSRSIGMRCHAQAQVGPKPRGGWISPRAPRISAVSPAAPRAPAPAAAGPRISCAARAARHARRAPVERRAARPAPCKPRCKMKRAAAPTRRGAPRPGHAHGRTGRAARASRAHHARITRKMPCAVAIGAARSPCQASTRTLVTRRPWRVTTPRAWVSAGAPERR